MNLKIEILAQFNSELKHESFWILLVVNHATNNSHSTAKYGPSLHNTVI